MRHAVKIMHRTLSSLRKHYTMKLNTKTKVLGTIGLLAGSSLNSGAQVLLTVEEIDTGGVSFTASDSIDTSNFNWAFDGMGSGLNLAILDGNDLIVDNGDVSEVYTLSGADVAAHGLNIFYDAIDGGQLSNSFAFSSLTFQLFGTAADSDGMSPALSTFNFDFVLTDNDGDINDYTDGLVLWDSNGFDTEGGQTVTFAVNSVPEPSSTALLGLGAMGLLVRRKRST